jgi:hypothetical protein
LGKRSGEIEKEYADRKFKQLTSELRSWADRVVKLEEQQRIADDEWLLETYDPDDKILAFLRKVETGEIDVDALEDDDDNNKSMSRVIRPRPIIVPYDVDDMTVETGEIEVDGLVRVCRSRPINAPSDVNANAMIHNGRKRFQYANVQCNDN